MARAKHTEAGGFGHLLCAAGLGKSPGGPRFRFHANSQEDYRNELQCDAGTWRAGGVGSLCLRANSFLSEGNPSH